MNKFYRKPSPETMKNNRDEFRNKYAEEISWLKANLSTLGKSKNSFLVDMYTIMVTGSRKITPKMELAIKSSIEKCKKHPVYNPELKEEADKKFKPILEKINLVEGLAEQKGDKALGFIKNIKEFVKNNYHITKKQMTALNKVYKRCTEDLFKGEE